MDLKCPKSCKVCLAEEPQQPTCEDAFPTCVEWAIAGHWYDTPPLIICDNDTQKLQLLTMSLCDSLIHYSSCFLKYWILGGKERSLHNWFSICRRVLP